MKIRIGLIGEDPNDTKAIEHLMRQQFDCDYKTISKNQRGSKMFNGSAIASYNLELSTSVYHCVIIIVDADGIITEEDKIRQKKKKCDDLAKKLKCSSILLLNIYELEALILADIEGLNTFYNIKDKIKFKSSVSHQHDAKGFLKRESGKYKESDCPKLFQTLNINTIRKNCAYFNRFLNDFEKAVAS